MQSLQENSDMRLTFKRDEIKLQFVDNGGGSEDLDCHFRNGYVKFLMDYARIAADKQKRLILVPGIDANREMFAVARELLAGADYSIFDPGSLLASSDNLISDRAPEFALRDKDYAGGSLDGEPVRLFGWYAEKALELHRSDGGVEVYGKRTNGSVSDVSLLTKLNGPSPQLRIERWERISPTDFQERCEGLVRLPPSTMIFANVSGVRFPVFPGDSESFSMVREWVADGCRISES